MQPRFTVGILVLKAEGVVSTVRYSVFLFQTAPTSVVAKPNQIAVVVVAHQLLAVEGDGGEAVDVETLVFGNEIVKEQMVQTTSKKIVRSSEKQELCACVPHTHYVEIRGFMRATAC